MRQELQLKEFKDSANGVEEIINLLDFTKAEMENFAEELGEKKFRGRQLFKWVQKGVVVQDMKNLSKTFRERLMEVSETRLPDVLSVQKSKTDGTRKYLFGLKDGNMVESVFMKYKYGNSICLSTQAGCRMGCRFCASTRKGLERNLTSGEIIGQFLAAEKESGEKIGHIVLMGTGEPFDNYENVSKFISIINDPEGTGLGMRNITVSTCGIVPAIADFAEDFPQVNLAISLHGTTDEIRSRMMPVNDRWHIEELISACRKYVDKTGRRITFEYTLVNGKNDSDEDIKRLADLLRGLNCHVNLIPLNRVDETGFDTVSRKRAEEWKKALERKGIQATVRRELGSDIDAACGQLRLNNLREEEK